MSKVIYVKKANSNEDVINSTRWSRFSTIIYHLKKIFHCITKKQIDNKEVWILPIIKGNSNASISRYIKKMSNFSENKYVFPDDLITKENQKLFKGYSLNYFNGQYLKKILILEMLKYILKIQEKKFEETDITVLVQSASIENEIIIQKLVHIAKSVKIVSPNLYQFKQMEETLYKQEGIALQLSHSYRKSLVKSKVIINLDTNSIDVNMYRINARALILHCEKVPLVINNKAFNGVVINSCNIEWEGKNEEYDNLVFYESLLEGLSFKKIFEKLQKDKVKIKALIGNHGKISEKEFKNLK